MIIRVDDVTQSSKAISFSERTAELNNVYAEGQIRDFRFPAFLDVQIDYYRLGNDLFFQGSFRGHFEGHCSRCLQQYPFILEKSFEFVLSPAPAKSDNKKISELNREELGLSYYSGEEINLTPLIKEQILLALPTRPLCEENCLGLCGSCGANLNFEACACSTKAADPRTAIFRTLKVGR
jgi:uncharacterized protein